MKGDLLFEGSAFLISRVCVSPSAQGPSTPTHPVDRMALFGDDSHLIFSLFRKISFMFTLSGSAEVLEEGSIAQMFFSLVMTFYNFTRSLTENISSGKKQKYNSVGEV